jgi:Anthrone oxygenase
MILEMLATVSAGLFSGAAIYINLVEHPARMECGPTLALKQFPPSYKKATVTQVGLAGSGFLAGTASWLLREDLRWLIGAIILVSVIPFTLLVVFPTVKKLHAHSLNQNPELASRLLVRWGRLHAVRSVLSFTSFVIFVIASLR